MEKEYSLSQESVLEQLETTEAGLTSQQAAKRLEQYGPNKLKEAAKPTWIQRFFAQMKDPMLIILMVAAGVSAITGMLSGENEWAEVIIILAVVLLNAILGVVQESKAEAAIEALQTMTGPRVRSSVTESRWFCIPLSWCPAMSWYWRPAMLCPLMAVSLKMHP